MSEDPRTLDEIARLSHVLNSPNLGAEIKVNAVYETAGRILEIEDEEEAADE